MEGSATSAQSLSGLSLLGGSIVGMIGLSFLASSLILITACIFLIVSACILFVGAILGIAFAVVVAFFSLLLLDWIAKELRGIGLFESVNKTTETSKGTQTETQKADTVNEEQVKDCAELATVMQQGNNEQGLAPEGKDLLVERNEFIHFYINVDREEWKLEVLCHLYEILADARSVIFVNKNLKVKWLADKMLSRDLNVSGVHTGMDPVTCSRTMDKFRTGSCRVLITTDAFAGRFSLQQVPVVVNYDLPGETENYLSRVGRNGSFGREGWVINFVTSYEESRVHEIERFYNVVMEELSWGDHTRALLKLLEENLVSKEYPSLG